MDMFQSWPLTPGSAFRERQIKGNQLPHIECSQRVYPAQGQGASQEKLLWATACLTFSGEEELCPPPDKLLPIFHYYHFSMFKLAKLDVNSTNMDQNQPIPAGSAPAEYPENIFSFSPETSFFHSRGNWMHHIRRTIENPRSDSLGVTWESVFVCFTVGILTLLNPT